MKLILRADVDNLGRLGDEVVVKPGYGRNYLVPKGLAMVATDSNRKVFEQERRKLQAKMDAVKAAAQAIADKVNEKEVYIKVRVGEGDKLYGSVTSQHIVDALAEKGVQGLDKKKLVLPEFIRSLGMYQIEVRLHPDVSAEIAVIVVPHTWKEGDPIPGTEEPEEGEVALEDTEETQPEAPAEEATETAETDEAGQSEEEPQS
jgi:large subunit ribosomal protein L9